MEETFPSSGESRGVPAPVLLLIVGNTRAGNGPALLGAADFTDSELIYYRRLETSNEDLEFYQFPIEQRLPKIRIPPRRQDDDAVLDLQTLIDQAYHNGGFDKIDYSLPPLPLLEGDIAYWAADRIAACGAKIDK